ncbi:DUF3083 family protein [Catenovulum sp. SM1970]|uniref:DUF3083 family protein n=1 Tax=Marinifaba aquimaris TaxID=2741323 RepID=UPI001571AF5B|nr:DUF3083 family protein [Marinifaba aquimaris]NTS78043.1 DUF3083 family protein [Marinifaba aquimaris]
MRRSTSILRKHRANERVYIPSDASDSHYILAEIKLTDQLIESVAGSIDTNAEKPYQTFYQQMAHKIFETVEAEGITHVNMVANNKLVRVRYSDEQQVLHTEQQSYFFYNPLHNSTFKGYFDGAVRARKIKILFLAKGEELRVNSGKFHTQVHQAVTKLSEKLGLEKGSIKLRDHQHLTFDVFSHDKGHRETITHHFREIADRYKAQGYEINPEHTSITYAALSVPMTRRLLKGTEIDYSSTEPFTKVYEKIEEAFKQACEDSGIDQSAMIAKPIMPFVRYDENERADIQGELLHIGVNPENEEGRFCVHWDPSLLVDTIRFMFFADVADENNNSYGKFVNQVIDATENFADNVNWKKEQDDLIIRVHQHTMEQV